VSGKRALSKMNAFDLIVTVALGSTLATVLLTGDVALLEGLLALGLLISLHLAIGWYSVCSERVQELVKAQLRLLVHRGRLLPAALRAERLTTEEISAALRAEGTGAVEEVDALWPRDRRHLLGAATDRPRDNAAPYHGSIPAACAPGARLAHDLA
jgi:uncharacterized membrane protein YcaP (DUF421 family)